MPPRERAWNDIHDLLPEWWQVGPATFDPDRHCWMVTPRSPKYGGRLRPPATITAQVRTRSQR